MVAAVSTQVWHVILETVTIAVYMKRGKLIVSHVPREISDIIQTVVIFEARGTV